MARDFDFVRKNRSLVPKEPASSASKPSEKPKAPPPSVSPRPNPIFPDKPHHSKKTYQKAGWALALLIVGVVVTLTYLYYISLQKTDSSKTNTSGTTTQASTTKPTTDLKVQLFDRGTGEAGITSAATALKNAGLTVEQATSSSLVYDKSYIFFNTLYREEATKIQTTLSSFEFELKESPLPGISVYLGKK